MKIGKIGKVEHNASTKHGIHVRVVATYINPGDIKEFHVDKTRKKPHKDGEKIKPLTCWNCI